MKPIVLVAIIFAIQLVPKTGSAEDVRKMALCKKGKIVRTLRVEKDHRDQVGWITTYSKDGAEAIIGEGLNPASCEDVMLRVQKAIEDGGWKCRAVQSVSVERGTASN